LNAGAAANIAGLSPRHPEVAHQRSKRFDPQLQETFQMFFRLSLCFAIAVVRQEIAMGQARVPRPKVSLKCHTANHDTADQCRLGM
jgi:hypothetical protein